MSDSQTVPGIGPGKWDKGALAREQESHAETVTYRLYVGDNDNLIATITEIVARYFQGATITYSTGVWQGDREPSFVVDIVATRADLQKVVALAGDLRLAGNQTCVLLTWAPVTSLLVTA